MLVGSSSWRTSMRARSPKTSITRRSTGRPRRRLLLLCLADLAALAALVVVGRWEGPRHARSVGAPMRRPFEAVGTIDRRSLAAHPFALASAFDSLSRKRGADRL